MLDNYIEENIFPAGKERGCFRQESVRGYLAFGVGFGIIPLAIYLFNDGKNSFVAGHAKQALKAQAIIGILSFVAAILSWVLIGLVMWPFIAVLALVWFCCSIYACFRVLDGREYHYPLL